MLLLLVLISDHERLRFADMLYTPEGKQVTEKLWSETIAELSFADVQGTLNSIKKN